MNLSQKQVNETNIDLFTADFKKALNDFHDSIIACIDEVFGGLSLQLKEWRENTPPGSP